MKRRDFFKATGLLAAGAAFAGSGMLSGCASGGPHGLRLSFEPYELLLRHTFTVSSYSRTTTPGVQVRIDYDGLTGYGEASMPPYLGQTVESVCAFLSRVDLGQFNDPFRLEEILAYVDSLSPNSHFLIVHRQCD